MTSRILVVALMFALLINPAMAQEAAPESPRKAEEVLVKFKTDAVNLKKAEGKQRAAAFVEGKGLSIERHLEAANIAIVKAPNAKALAAQLKNDPEVEYAEPNARYVLSAADPNDTRFRSQYALKNTGQPIYDRAGTEDADIDGVEAWDMSRGDGALVAVIDSGVAYAHPDLDQNMWDGSGCVSEAGLPLGNCVHGYDFPNEDKDPAPTVAHGTHVAGIIAAEMNNAEGIAGVAPKATLMALRTDRTDVDGTVYLETVDIVRAIDFARENGADIINASFGGGDYSEAMREAISRFNGAGGLFVASAGNAGTDIDATPHYPASYDLPNVIAVGATDNSDVRAGFSNYGTSTVDLYAPGVGIMSTVPDSTSSSCGNAIVQPVNGPYECMHGTSMAAPQVAGVAALLVSFKPSITVAEMREAMVATGNDMYVYTSASEDTIPYLITVAGRRVNAQSALVHMGGMMPPPPPPAPTTGTVTLVGKVVNNNFRTGTLADFRYTLDGGAPQAIGTGTTTLTLPLGTHALVGVATAAYTTSSTCANVMVTASTTASCVITFDDKPDTVAPVITLLGTNPQTMTVGQAYVEQGATAADDLDGQLPSSSIVINKSGVNTKAAGTYYVTYTAKDRTGNISTVRRTVNVVKKR